MAGWRRKVWSSVRVAAAFELVILGVAALICWRTGDTAPATFASIQLLISLGVMLVGIFAGMGYQSEVKPPRMHMVERVPGTDRGFQARLHHSANQIGASANILLVSVLVPIFSVAVGALIEML